MNEALIGQTQLKKWSKCGQLNTLEQWLRDNGIKYFKNRKGEIVTTIAACNEALLGQKHEESAPNTKMQMVAVGFMFAIETGMRMGEICGLTAENISANVATLPQTKNGTARRVPLSKRAIELLSFVPDLWPLKPHQFEALFRKGRDRSGVVGLTFHDTRHEAITRLAKKLDVLELARMVGHRDIKQLLTYYNETAENLAAKLD